jgi:hypothetical protein
MVYYADHNSLSAPKGNLLLVGDSDVSDRDVEGFPFSFELSTPFESLVLAAKSAEERASWKFAVSKAVRLSISTAHIIYLIRILDLFADRWSLLAFLYEDI